MPVNPVLPSAALNSRQPRSVPTRQLPEVPRGRPEGEEEGGNGAAAPPPPLPTRRSAPATEDPHLGNFTRAGIFKQSMGARKRVERGLSYRPAKLQGLAELNPWNRFLDSLKVKKFWLCVFVSVRHSSYYGLYRDVYSGSRIQILICYPPRIPDPDPQH
jgi:hypothetical protein